MKLLRDESGHILILRSPFSLRSKTAAVEHSSVTPVPKPVIAAPPAVQAVTFHCCFTCQWCVSPILLPHDEMGLPFAHPSVRRIEVRTIAAICGSCHHIANYSLFRGCPGFDTRHKLMPAPAVGATFLYEWLTCDATGCPYHVPLFVNLDCDLSDKEKPSLTANLIWHDLKCIAGHRIGCAVSAPRPGVALTAI